MDRPFYTLQDISQMTGITERTLRKRLAEGAMRGEKLNGRWRFSPEQVGAFLDRPEVRRLAAQHRRALADDFLNVRTKRAPTCLCVVDMPGGGEAFMDHLLSVCAGAEMTYGYDDHTGMARVTLVGEPGRVAEILRAIAP